MLLLCLKCNKISNSIEINNKKKQIDEKIKQIKVPESFVFQIIGININKQSFNFFPKNRFNVNSPTICLVNCFSEFTTVVSQRQTPNYKKNEPNIFNNVIHNC